MQDDDLDMEFPFYEDEIPDDYDAIAYVVSKSMEPNIRNGDYLFIKNPPQIDYNTIGIFQVDGATMSRNSAKATSKNSIPNTPTST